MLFLHSANLLFSSMKMGQWPIFSGASLPLSRLALPPFLHFSPFLSAALLLWAFELISAGSARCLVGHEAVCKENNRALLFFLLLLFFFVAFISPPPHPIILCTLSFFTVHFRFCIPLFTVQACVVGKGAVEGI